MAYKLLLPIATREQFPSQPNQPTNITFPKECSLENFAHFNHLGQFTGHVALVALCSIEKHRFLSYLYHWPLATQDESY